MLTFLLILFAQSAVNNNQVKVVPPPPQIVLLAVDTDGSIHPVALSGITIVKTGGVYTLTLPSTNEIKFEVPKSTSSTTWTLANNPTNQPSCFRNGLIQFSGQDYTISGNTITSNFWAATDTLFCNYTK